MAALSQTQFSLEKEDRERDSNFKSAMHKNTGAGGKGFSAMLGKNHEAQGLAVDEYFKHWDNKASATETEETRKARRDEYATLTRHYYNLATDLYDKGEPFRQALARHEHYLALKMNLQEDMKVLDVGCGVGGPAREIVKFSGVNVVGLNNNDYQIERATNYAKQEKLDHKLTFTKGDFMQMPYPDNSFDAVYAIEATVHAPSLEGIYSEIHRVLKPGGVFGVYEWLMTEKYDNGNPQHRDIRLGIEQGDGISNMEPIPVALAAMKAAGFTLEANEDLADRPDEFPWYWPLSGDLRYMQSIWDFPTLVRMTHIGRGLVHRFVGALEMIKLAPRGTQKTADSLALAADCLVEGGKQKLFTPMYLMVGRKAKN
ncbi:Delta(24)-sterol C-methyltransferase [Elasticomyces elasticus]|nr:Delta(24)-sterol C-methyltransferase [Elasticomyces elasticus]KAK3666735.1 Delta(24)-sterol C-methyltransferase [Elasticomyces elasticus]KAK4920423.1 Delta(24)-sterol C-methyltransferase [Elasticomyces elasticus]KAK5759290.1 Delta(24)-sterol C-methyltransferase [Elasticomyces elasticus]